MPPQFFTVSLLQILLGLFLNTLTHVLPNCYSNFYTYPPNSPPLNALPAAVSLIEFGKLFGAANHPSFSKWASNSS